MKRETYTVEEVAEILGIGRGKCYQAVRDKEIPSLKIGRRYVIPRMALEEMLNLTERTEKDGDLS